MSEKTFDDVTNENYLNRPLQLNEYIHLFMMMSSVTQPDKPKHLSDTVENIANMFGVDLTGEMLNDLKNSKMAMKRLKMFQDNYDEILVPTRLKENLKKLQKEASLRDGDVEVLKFLIVMKQSQFLTKTFGYFSSYVTLRDFYKFMQDITMMCSKDLKSVFMKSAPLIAIDLIDVREYDEFTRLNSRFDVLDTLSNSVYHGEFNDDERIFDSLYKISSEPKLTLKNYKHVNEEIQMLKSIIKNSRNGANVLLYGEPGTGKTELVRALVKNCKKTLFDIATTNEYGMYLNVKSRLKTLKVSQFSLSSVSNSVILFDEVDGSFNYTHESYESDTPISKGWMNDLLDEPKTPTFWVINSLMGIDRAFLRRFDVVLKLPNVDTSSRKQIVNMYSRKLNVEFDKLQLTALYQHNVSPAIIEKAVSVVSHTKSKDAKKNSRNLITLCNGVLQASGLPTIKPVLKTVKPVTKYNVELLNTNVDVKSLVDGITRTGKGLFCFYGAPGTGKTELGKFLAHCCKRKVIQKKVSDITSAWVGATEKNIANAFKEAKDSNSVLIFDEADSYLTDRRQAKNSWEISQVNEMLTQMETFDGVFICTTNLMDGLDQASLRRFSMKVEFSWLKPEQSVRMLKFESVGRVSTESINKISRMKALAPGDFSSVKKRLELLGVKPTARNLVESLEEEIKLKKFVDTKTIGF